jgi:phosphoribosylformimino-5-aminoimidazole carboxamide ribotide isomerase
MEIIPVLDLKGGHVVRARLGQREHYRPIETPLAESSSPADVLRGFLKLYPFRKFYVADLDAIARAGDHGCILETLASQFHEEFWVDCGVADPTAARKWLDTRPGHLVLGSESLSDVGVCAELHDHPRLLLSLDFRGANFLGPPDLLENPAHWPRRIIVMTMDRVGGSTGPDFARIAGVRKLAGARAVFAAGGIRDIADLIALHRAGVSGALVASSLHDGRLSGDELAKLAAAGGRQSPAAGADA